MVAHEAMRLDVAPGIDTDVWSLNGDHLGTVNTTREDGLATARCTTPESGVDIVVAYRMAHRRRPDRDGRR